MNKFAIAVSSLVVSAPLMMSSAAWAQQSGVVAKIGAATVTQTDITTFVKGLSPSDRANLAADPSRLDPVLRAQLGGKAVLAEAHAKGWDQQPQIKAQILAAERAIIVRTYVASVSAPPASYPSEAEIEDAYHHNASVMMQPRALHIAQIFIATPATTDAGSLNRARELAQQVAQRAKAPGADFAALAKANTQDKAGALNGGDMGYVQDGSMTPEIRQTADALKPGEVAGPIQTSAGFHVIKLIDVREAGMQPLAQVKERIRSALRAERANENQQAYMTKIAGPGTLKIDEDGVKKAVLAAQ